MKIHGLAFLFLFSSLYSMQPLERMGAATYGVETAVKAGHETLFTGFKGIYNRMDSMQGELQSIHSTLQRLETQSQIQKQQLIAQNESLALQRKQLALLQQLVDNKEISHKDAPK